MEVEVIRQAGVGSAAPQKGTGSGMSEHYEYARAYTRGVVINPEDLTFREWPERAKEAGLTTLALHDSRAGATIAAILEREEGQRFLDACQRLGLAVEYELHAARDLLPRSLFEANPELFRMNDAGERTPDANLCVHSERALGIVAEAALRLAKTLRPSTGRYFYWGDDGAPACRCPHCRDLNPADQALLVENRILAALRTLDPHATLAHLAYAYTLTPPSQVRPAPGVFLEFAPGGLTCIEKVEGDASLGTTDRAVKKRYFELLDANLEHFDAGQAQVLEYWLDVSAFAGWRKPVTRALDWEQRRPAFAQDLEAYRSRGIRQFTTFACYADADYVSAFGELPLAEYASAL
jgi:hypothetical protein